MALAPFERFIDGIDPAFREGDPEADVKPAEARNVGLLRESYLALSRGDFDAALDLLHDDVEFEITGPPAIPFLGRWRGRPVVGEAMRRNFAMVEAQEPEIHAVIAQGDTVVVVAHERGRMRATGAPYAVHWVHLCTFRDGKVARFREIVDGYAIGGGADL